MKRTVHFHDGKLSRPECFDKMLSYSNLSSLLGVKKQLEKYASQYRPLTAFVHMAYPDDAASDTRPLPMFSEIIARNMISHDRVTDFKVLFYEQQDL